MKNPIISKGLYVILIAAALVFIPYANSQKREPPWNQPPEGGINFTVPDVENVPDLYGDIVNPDLVIFFGGNEFMVGPELIRAFQQANPQYKRIFYETLPPGVIEAHLKTGSLVIGNLRIELRPDIITAGQERIARLTGEGWFLETVPYAANRLAIMVHQANPKDIKSLADLGRDDVLVGMPDPEIEDIAKKILQSFEKAGGQSLVQKIMNEKLTIGTAFLTRIHHRQTPLWIMQQRVDAGPVWFSEALFQSSIGNPIGLLEIPATENSLSVSVAGRLRNASHPQAAADFIAFIQGETAQAIYGKYGFLPPQLGG